MPNSSVTIPAYRDYFRQFAIHHKDILHNQQSEDDDSTVGEKHFSRWSADEIITGLRSKVGWPALLLENYEIITTAQSIYDIKGGYSGAFTILDSAEKGNYKSEDDAWQKTERITWEILQQIWQDHYGKDKDRCSTPFTDFYFANINIMPVGPLFDNEFGWRVEFQFKPKVLINITAPPPDGTFI